MMKAITNWLYDVITSSGIILYLMPILKHFMWQIVFTIDDKVHKIKDAKGATLNATLINGKVYPAFGVDQIIGIKNATVRKDDVILSGYPKTGCHWVHEILHMLVTKKTELTKYGKQFGGMIDAVPPIILDSLPSPRVLNSHVCYDELPVQMKARKTKIVWTVRSPKDVVVSYYKHVTQLFQCYGYDGKFEDFFQLFMNGELEYGSYFDMVLDWEKAIKTQHVNPIFVVEYEKLKGNTVGMVKELAKFLEIDITDEFARQVVTASDFKTMKTKRKENTLFRKGVVGDWVNWLSGDQSAQINKMWADRMTNCNYQPAL